jgi:hypothetical protein
MTTLTMKDEKRLEIIQIVFRGELTMAGEHPMGVAIYLDHGPTISRALEIFIMEELCLHRFRR